MLVSMLLFAIVVTALRPKNTDASANPVAEAQELQRQSKDELGSRVLSFPEDRAVGTIEIRPTDANLESNGVHPSSWKPRRTSKGSERFPAVTEVKQWVSAEGATEWKQHGTAKGSVMVPAGHDVKLRVNADGGNDMSFLRHLPSDAFFGLDLGLSQIEDEQMPFVAHLTGLRMIRLEDTRVTGKGMQHLSALSNLLGFASDTQIANQFAGDSPYAQKSDPFGGDSKAESIYGVDDLAASIFLSMPNIREIHLRDDPMTSDALPILGQLKRLERISLELCDITDENLEYLARLPSLTSLSLSYPYKRNKITDAGAAKLAIAMGLKDLDLHGARITIRGLAEIAQLPNLESLNIEGTTIQPADLTVLKNSTKLRILEADWNGPRTQDYAFALSEIRTLESIGGVLAVNPEGLRLLLSLPNLQSLFVSTGSGDSFEGIGEALGKCVKLKALGMDSIPLSDGDLLQCNRLAELESLCLFGTGIRGPGLSILKNFTKLKKLYLESDEEIDMSFLPKLEQLNHVVLRMASMSSDPQWYSRIANVESAMILALVGDRQLKGMSQWKKLKSLNLTNSALSDAAVPSLAPLKQLEFLRIGGSLTPLGLAGMRVLPRLRTLRVASPFFDQSHIESLVQQLGSVIVSAESGGK